MQAIKAAANGDALIARSVTARLLATFAHRRDGMPPAQPVAPLTDREEEVLMSVARGRTNAEIATELFISLLGSGASQPWNPSGSLRTAIVWPALTPSFLLSGCLSIQLRP